MVIGNWVLVIIMRSITLSAPGKVMLLGEHAVVYGQPCLVTAVNQRLQLTIEQSDGEDKVETPEVGDTRFLDATIALFKEKFHLKTGLLKITTNCIFSGKYGFGSSSAVTSAMVAALSQLYNLNLSERQLFDLAYLVVLNVQGLGSGFDVAAGIFGGTLYYVKGGRVLEKLDNNILNDGAEIIVGYTGIKSHTVDLVRQVAEKKAREPEKFDRIMLAIGQLVNNAKIKLAEKDWERLGTLMDFNQEYLRNLGVSSEKLESLISAAKRGGALGAKLSGAGGGDCMIALARSDKREEVKQAISNAGGEALNMKLGAEGVKVEE